MALLTPELLRRLEQFQLLAARRAKSSAKGERRSRARGQSVEFADHRSYVAAVVGELNGLAACAAATFALGRTLGASGGEQLELLEAAQ